MDVSPATPAAAGLSEEDAAALATPFVRALVRQIRSHDTTGVWESKSDTELLEPYVITAEQRRAMPVIADPNAKQLWRLDQYWAAAGLAVEQASGIIATPMIKITHEGFGRAILIAGRLVVASRIMRDVHRFGFTSLSKLAADGGKLVAGALQMIEKFPEPARE
ncbi:MAG: NifX-associated nitrogen fixation protein [Rhodospirillales bacterium]|nr:NifX-associated nitrogen fixation protein [Rhodospirillales bacterium]